MAKITSASVPRLIATCSSTTQGLRGEQQDRYCIQQMFVNGQPGLVLAVADGMGGLTAGGSAADLAIRVVLDHAAKLPRLTESSSPRIRAALVDLFADANARVVSFARANRITNMGTTLVVALVVGRRMFVANVGDSRCYRISKRGVELVTRDHSVAKELVDAGQMGEDDPRLEVYRNQLTRSLGEPGGVPVDVFPARGSLLVADDSVILLCTDGLHGKLLHPGHLRTLLDHTRLDEACSKLVLLAFKNGSTDNITLVSSAFGSVSGT